jgi:hypothetical protein
MKRIRQGVVVCLLILSLALSTASGRGAAAGAQIAGLIFATAAAVAVMATVEQATQMVNAPGSTVIVCVVPARTRVRVLKRTPDGRWAKIRLPDGRVGWVSANLLPLDK